MAQKLSLIAPEIYEVVRREGEEELARPNPSLWWSGVAAGLCICTSLLLQGILQQRLPDAAWAPLVSSLGYSAGFIIVILGRLQLFTENTITTVLPLLAEPSLATLLRTLRLWLLVFTANMTGTFFVAAMCHAFGVVPDWVLAGMLTVSHHLLELTALQAFTHAIPAGFLVAAIVWILPSAAHSAFAVVLLLTYVISAGGFTHVVAGSLDVFLLLLGGEVSLAWALGGMILPVLCGNVIGGTGLFALLAYAQVREEIPA